MKTGLNHHYGGFMLLEALVAIVIFALTSGAFLSILNSTQQGSKIIPLKTCALWVAQNQLALIIINNTPRNKIESQGNEQQCDKKWRWTITTNDIPDPRFWQIKISVYDNQRLEATQYGFMPN